MSIQETSKGIQFSPSKPKKSIQKNHTNVADINVESKEELNEMAEKSLDKTTEASGNTVNITAGDRSCYLYFDTEFTGLQKNATLISIGIVDADGRSFYAEFTDYDIQQIDGWILENVIKTLQNPDTVLEGDHWTIKGTTKEIRTQLFFWLDKYITEKRPVQFVADVSHYDFVLLLDLLLDGSPAIDLPNWISPCCLDINQDIATSLVRVIPEGKTEEEFNKNYIPILAAFDINRDEYANAIPSFNYEGKKHNSLYDAMVVRAIHQNLWNLEK